MLVPVGLVRGVGFCSGRINGLLGIGAHLHDGAHRGLEALLLEPAGQLAVAAINMTQVL